MPSEKTILLVEDDDVDAMMFTRNIKSLRPEIKVVRAANGQEAIDQLNAIKPQIIVMDIRMPLMDGREALVLMKNDKRFLQIPVVMMTTSENPDDIKFCYQNYANAYIPKGIDSKSIKTDVSNLLNFWLDSARLAAC